MALVIGDTVEQYVVEAILGSGASALVYRVRSKDNGQLYALKSLLSPDENLSARLRTEGRLQGELGHDNIVGVHHVIDVRGQPTLVMDYVDGGSLSELLRIHGPSIDDALSLFGGILRGVAIAHARGVTHRDLKPANILLDIREDGLFPRITDFGLAKVIDPDGSRRRTMSGISMGTPAYMAPEQFVSAKHVTHSADLFSLGCILYRLTCHKRAFSGTDPIQVSHHIASQIYPDPHSVRPELPVAVAAAIRACLRSSPQERIPSVQALTELLFGEAVVPRAARPDSAIAKAVAKGHSVRSNPNTARPIGVPRALGWEKASLPTAKSAAKPQAITALIWASVLVALTGLAAMAVILVASWG